MCAQQKERPKLRVRAQHIGPIMELDAALSSKRQNLIFARNGTGKSFIARSLRLLDPSQVIAEAEEEIPTLLVSEESDNKQGTFGLYEGEKCIGSIGLNALHKKVVRSEPFYIYHVFSEDFVDAHVRDRLSDLDGNITNEILIGKENNEIDDKRTKIEENHGEIDGCLNSLRTSFETAKGKLKSDFSIVGSLGAFKKLSVESLFIEKSMKGSESDGSVSEILTKFTLFKSLPSDPRLPLEIDFPGSIPLKEELRHLLEKRTSPSSVAEEFKLKIHTDLTFFERGVSMLCKEPDVCPFCTQRLSEAAQQAVDAYTQFFEDEESKHKKALKNIDAALSDYRKYIASRKNETLQAKANFDSLKKFFPSTSGLEAHDIGEHLAAVQKHVDDLREAVSKKLNDLRVSVPHPSIKDENLYEQLAGALKKNRNLYDQVRHLTENSKEERLSLQNLACVSFEREFRKKYESEIGKIADLRSSSLLLTAEIEQLQLAYGESANARDRVVETFRTLLRHFFADTYTFDGDSFSVRRNNIEISRGPDRTLSDGEKSIIAFCYYIARIHMRVIRLEDYERLYFIVDDPVSSLSFDYVYGIAQCLKDLRVDSDGVVSLLHASPLPRPRMLILTHNSYFYNVVSTNDVVNRTALFQLQKGKGAHTLRSQAEFATPHLLQLLEVYQVANGTPPTHTTANCIRSVIESIGKFIRPDLKEFGAFVKHLTNDHGLHIKSVLINDLCHGGKYNDPPHQEAEIVEAAKEAISVVEQFAPGQLKSCQALKL